MKEINGDIVEVEHDGVKYKCTMREVAVGTVVAKQIMDGPIKDIRKLKKKVNWLYSFGVLVAGAIVKYLFFSGK